MVWSLQNVSVLVKILKKLLSASPVPCDRLSTEGHMLPSAFSKHSLIGGNSRGYDFATGPEMVESWNQALITRGGKKRHSLGSAEREQKTKLSLFWSPVTLRASRMALPTGCLMEEFATCCSSLLIPRTWSRVLFWEARSSSFISVSLTTLPVTEKHSRKWAVESEKCMILAVSSSLLSLYPTTVRDFYANQWEFI